MNPQLLHELAGRTWAMDKTRLVSMLHAARSGLTPATPQARNRSVARAGNVAVIPIQGPLDSRESYFLDVFGGTSYASIRMGLREALADASVSGIVFLVDSPGGVTDDLPELAEEIFKARGKKAMAAVVTGMCCSAALFLAAQADEMIIAKYSAYVGSCGVYAEREDYSRALDEAGITITLVSAGIGKTEGHPATPATDEELARLQARVDDLYGLFVDAMVRGRGVTASTVRKTWMAYAYATKDALRLGMADRIGTFEDGVARVASGKVTKRAAAASWVASADTPDSEPIVVPAPDGHPKPVEDPAVTVVAAGPVVFSGNIDPVVEDPQPAAPAPVPSPEPEPVDDSDSDMALSIAERQLQQQ